MVGCAIRCVNGLQSVASSLQQMYDNFVQAEAGFAPLQPAPYLYTSSAIDPSVAPDGKHTAYIACASYPSRFADGGTWQQRGEARRIGCSTRSRSAHQALKTVYVD